MKLEKENVLLRAVEPTDLENMYNWENNINVWKVSQTVSPFSKYTLKEYCSTANLDIQVAKQLRLIIAVVEDNKNTAIGTVDFFDYDAINRRVGIGILIGNENFRNQGFATKSIEIALDYCFKILNLHQIHCLVGSKNKTSIELFKKSGFQSCGIVKDWLLRSGEWEDVCFFQKLNELK